MLDVCMMDISKLMDEARFRLAYQLSDFRRQKKCDSIATKEDKCRCIGAGLLLSYMLRNRNVRLKEEEISYSEAGKPYLTNHQDVFFNLSHSGRFVVCAVADCEVGIDIQEVKACNMKMAERFFHKDEVHLLNSICDEDKQNRKFTELFR